MRPHNRHAEIIIPPSRDEYDLELLGPNPENKKPRHLYYQPRRGTLYVAPGAKDEPSKPPAPRPPGVLLL